MIVAQIKGSWRDDQQGLWIVELGLNAWREREASRILIGTLVG